MAAGATSYGGGDRAIDRTRGLLARLHSALYKSTERIQDSLAGRNNGVARTLREFTQRPGNTPGKSKRTLAGAVAATTHHVVLAGLAFLAGLTGLAGRATAATTHHVVLAGRTAAAAGLLAIFPAGAAALTILAAGTAAILTHIWHFLHYKHKKIKIG